jgi:hypothetical protein
MKIRFLFGAISLVLTSLVTSAQQPETAPAILHVSSIHKATDAEKTYHTAFGMQFIEGTIGNLRYTLSDLTGWAGGCDGNWNWEGLRSYEVQSTGGHPHLRHGQKRAKR